MNISVVIPTCNRKSNLLGVLTNLNGSVYQLNEVIIVDSGEQKISTEELSSFKNLKLHYLHSEKSVCIQRNIGINKATSQWIFLCDDDIEMPTDYLQKLKSHIDLFPESGAVSGLWLERGKNEWEATHPEKSTIVIFWKFIFQLGIWGEINSSPNNIVIKRIKRYYNRKGNYISAAGWPVITNFSGEYFTTPVYSLGATLVKRDWLMNSPYDEVLDKHGIGDNYGVISGFPANIHVLNNAFVYHHQEPTNRLKRPLQYYRRVLALDYFIQKGKELNKIKKQWLIWSLIGNLLYFIFSMNTKMISAAFKSFWIVSFGRNPYKEAAKRAQKVIEPIL